MQKNVAGQIWTVFAFQSEAGSNPGQPVTGDAANITGNLRLDGGAANAIDDTNPAELEDGYYYFDITQAETNAEHILIAPESSTANVNVIGVPGAVYTTPANFPDLAVTATNGEMTVGSIVANAISAAAIATDAITAAKIAANAIGASELATDCITSDQLAATAVNDIWAKICETNGSRTAQQIMSIVLSAVAGVTSSGGAVFSDPAGTNTRITATVNASNERTAITLTPSS